MTNKLTRNQAVQIVGETAVAQAERDNCEPTNRVGYNGACQGDATIEWRGSAVALDKDGEECTVSVYYHTTQDEVDAAGEDLSNIKWLNAISHYTIV